MEIELIKKIKYKINWKEIIEEWNIEGSKKWIKNNKKIYSER